jgi:cell division protein FtsA
MQKSSPCFVGLDIGTSTVRCVVGVLNEKDEHPSILGVGESPTRGMRKGVVVHPEEVTHAVAEAVAQAERLSGIAVRGATITVNGAHVTSEASRGVIAIGGGHHITAADRDRVEEAATVIRLPANREIIQVFAKNYRIDGQDGIKDPVGMQGVRLEVDTQIVSGSTPNLRNLEMVLEKCNLIVHNSTVASVAAAEAVMPRKQKESGTALVDIGAGTTNIAVIEEGEIQYVGVLPVGGQHITNDLAIGLKVDLDIAERVKIEHASLLPRKSHDAKQAAVTEGKHTHYFPHDDITMIVEARVEEIMELVDRELKKIHRSRKLPGGVIFTGGTAKLPGLAETARDVLELPTKISLPLPLGGLAEQIQSPEFAAATGLMLLDMLLTPHVQGSSDGLNTGFTGMLKGIFKR